MKHTFLTIGLGLVIGVAGFAYLSQQGTETAPSDHAGTGEPIVSITMPEITGDALIGARIFEGTCATCHGQNGVGVDGAGPPLIHKIYEPSHHADEAFQRAVSLGVRGHHWSFGDMPPIEGLTRADVAMIATFIREIQRANGIR